MSLLNTTAISANYAQLALQGGVPSDNERFDIVTFDAKYQQLIWPLGNSGCQLGLGLRAGLLKVEDDSAGRLGGGALAECNWQRWVVWLPFDMVWLSQHEFGQRGAGFKNYGGPFQFIVGIGLGYQLSERWLIGYQYEHMSNANMYEQNPALNSHSLHIHYHF